MTEYAHAEADSHGLKWTNIIAMLVGHANALETRSVVDGFRPVIDGGVLNWKVVSVADTSCVATESDVMADYGVSLGRC